MNGQQALVGRMSKEVRVCFRNRMLHCRMRSLVFQRGDVLANGYSCAFVESFCSHFLYAFDRAGDRKLIRHFGILRKGFLIGSAKRSGGRVRNLTVLDYALPGQ